MSTRLTGRIINIDSSTWTVWEGAHLGERRLKSSLGCMEFEGTTRDGDSFLIRVRDGELTCGGYLNIPPHFPLRNWELAHNCMALRANGTFYALFRGIADIGHHWKIPFT